MRKLRVLMGHNYYQQTGGEDLAFENEMDVLRAQGHRVTTYIRRNEDLDAMGILAAGTSALWSRRTYREMHELIREHDPDLVHLHNTFPLISPSAYYSAQAHGVPVIQTLHNYRLTCPAATHFRDGRVCEDCIGKAVPWPSVLHACYRDSRPQNAVIAAMLTVHKGANTFRDQVDTYITPSTFMKQKLTAAGLRPERFQVKANSIQDPGMGQEDRAGALFVGRLTVEKGLLILIKAWRKIEGVPLDIVGTGPLEGIIRERLRSGGPSGVTLSGYQSHERVLAKLKSARMLIVPSLSYEGLPTTVIEAFACGTLVVGSEIGAVAEMLAQAGQTFTFAPGDADGLVRQVRQLARSPKKARDQGRAAREAYLRQYTPEKNYERLVEIYRSTLNL